MTTTIAPSQGSGIDFVQQGIGAAPGYSAIDVRRADSQALLQGCIGSAYSGSAGSGAYAVTQRGAGANMSVDIAASTGFGLLVAGTTIANQGYYTVMPHSAIINEAIATADPTNPRVDQIIVQVFDNVIDSSGKNLAQTTVLTGTPTAGATIGIGGNRNGAAALPANSYRLADVIVGNGVASITNANIFDRRPKTRGHCNISGLESRTNTAYGTLPTPDQVTEIVLPTDGLIVVAYQAAWLSSVSGVGQASIFLNANQLVAAPVTGASPGPVGVSVLNDNQGANITSPLSTFGGGLACSQNLTGSGYTGDATTGQLVSAAAGGGPCFIFAAAGTYHVSVQYKSSSGSVSVSARKLWVWTMAPDQAVLA